MVGLVDPEGCFQGVMSHNLYNPLQRDNLLETPLRISPVQILTHLDNRDRRPGREERRLILRIRRHRNHPLACRHILHIKPLRWQHQDHSIPLARVLCPVVAT